MIGGRYELDRKIGRGGMGSVWLGRDEVLGRAVAMKLVGVMAGGSSPDLVRAEREARIAASLNHPHVVGVFDLVSEQDQQWLVMEYVEGTTLAELIRTEGVLPAERVRTVLAQVARALQAAHTAGIVHRDVKPSNILVREDGQVKLSDFGIARARSDPSLTQTGLVTGSPAYLAPEVASGRPATPASDVWSLGATAYHGVVGRLPYDVGDNVLGALYRIVNEEPPRPEPPGLLGPLVAGTMVVDPTERWSMDQVVRFLDDPGSPAPAAGATALTALDPTRVVPVPSPTAAGVAVTSPRRRRWVLPGLVAAAVVALVVALVVLVTRNDPTTGPDRSTPAADSSTGSSTPDPTTSSSPPTRQPRVSSMRAFAADYLRTADRDPTTAFGDLTPAYQRASGGLAGYLGFWDAVEVTHVGPIVADPGSLSVSYDYTYRLPTGTRTDHVVLQLVFDARSGTYRIRGAA